MFMFFVIFYVIFTLKKVGFHCPISYLKYTCGLLFFFVDLDCPFSVGTQFCCLLFMTVLCNTENERRLQDGS